MADYQLQLEFRIGGVLTDMTSVMLVQVVRLDTAAVVVSTPAALTKVSTGLYRTTIAGLAGGVAHQASVEIVYDGTTSTLTRTFVPASLAADSASYLSLAEGDALAAAYPGLAKYVAAGSDVREAAMLLASSDVDVSSRWQGRKYDPLQVREFPRLAYADGCADRLHVSTPAWIGVIGCGGVVWDWDATTQMAIVPGDVKLAVLYQANAIIDGKLAAAKEEQAIGIASKAAGSVSVSFRDPAALAAVGGLDGLCDRASRLMKRFVLRTGQLL